MSDLINSLQAAPREDLPTIAPGDSVRVHFRIVEGDNERVQVFPGTVIGMGGSGNTQSIVVRRIASHGVGVERTFLLRSPRMERVEVVRQAKVRRARLNYLRGRMGKAARLRERRRN
jgi:large subunit ribosomal protein L19